MILLSGPEPQRSMLEQQLLKEFKACTKKTILVRGLPGNTQTIEAGIHVEVFNHLTASQLQQALNQSEFVICRSGYTTIMDLLKMKMKAMLIPTPGQTEQEYLATHMQAQGCFPFLNQSEFTISKAAAIVQNFDFQFPLQVEQFEYYRDAVASLTAIPDKL
jgi:UDP-N-acetylglucosamine:LPS N-acetylglucosamine transferase